ncbi:MAG: nitrous oxide-stimulated promoter family protein [Anaerolineae bacterium]
MNTQHPRLKRERQTIRAMIRLYCRDKHSPPGDLCPACEALLHYAYHRLDKCPFQESKPTCANCPIHCYAPDKRAQIRTVMRYAGPRMLWRHPILALRHLLDGLRKAERTTEK